MVADQEFTRSFVVMNGHIVGKADWLDANSVLGVDGGTVVTAKIPLEMQVVLVVDDSVLAAVHNRADFGSHHMRALLAALPACQYWGISEAPCAQVATYRIETGGRRAVPICDSHRDQEEWRTHIGDGWAVEELPYAPLVRHLVRYIEQLDASKAPEGDP